MSVVVVAVVVVVVAFVDSATAFVFRKVGAL